MKKMIAASLLTALAVPVIAFPVLAKSDVISAKKGKSEPAPKEGRDGGGEGSDPREGTYEGNDRGGSFDGGGYEGGGGGGGSFEGELFRSVEDRGDVLLVTSEVTTEVAPAETCTATTKKAIDKVTQKVIKTDVSEVCIDHN
ncbi:MAG: hypothetical protein J7501_11855 [Bdellovibrio sp.]|nr:hypothetical protein [Bdellovibrio sp.]